MKNKIILTVFVYLSFSLIVKAQNIAKDRTDSYLITSELNTQEIKTKLLEYLKSKNWEPSQLNKNDIAEFNNAFTLKAPQVKMGMAVFRLSELKFNETITIVDGGIIVKFHDYDHNLYGDIIGDIYVNNPSLEEQIKTAEKNSDKWTHAGTVEVSKLYPPYKNGYLHYTSAYWNKYIKNRLTLIVESYKKAINGTLKSISAGETETWRLIEDRLIPLNNSEFKEWAKENNLSKTEIIEWDEKRKNSLK